MSSQKTLFLLLCMMILCNLPSVTASPCNLSDKGLTFSTVKAAVDGCDAGTTVLALSSNQLTSLPSGVFDSVTSLTHLALDGNQLTSLPSGVFDSVTSLVSLYLVGNQFTSLPSGVFDELTSLTHLALTNNQLTSLPSGVFDKLTSLTHLALDGNQLTSLPSGVFDSVTSLVSLNLYFNQLTSLPSGVFDKLTSLTALYLSGNQFTSLPSGVFDELTSLTHLLLDSPVKCDPNVDDPDCEALSSCIAGVCGYVFTPTPTPTGRCSENAGVMADESGTYRCGNSQCHQLVAGEWTKIVQTAMSTADSESNADGTLILENDGIVFVANAGHEYYWPCECDGS